MCQQCLATMASTAQGKAAKAIKAVGDAKTKDALYAIITMIGNVQHESVKSMAGSIEDISMEKVSHMSASLWNEMERHKD